MHSRALITLPPAGGLAAEINEAVLCAKLRGLPHSHLTLGPVKQKAFVRMFTAEIPSEHLQHDICITEWNGLLIRTSDLPGLYVDGGEQPASSCQVEPFFPTSEK